MKRNVVVDEREIWLIGWISKTETRQDLWDLEKDEIITVALREWIKAQFDHYSNLGIEAKKLRESNK